MLYETDQARFQTHWKRAEECQQLYILYSMMAEVKLSISLHFDCVPKLKMKMIA